MNERAPLTSACHVTLGHVTCMGLGTGTRPKRNPSKLAPRTGRDEGAEKSIVCLYSRSRVVDSSSSFDISSQGDLLGSRNGLLLK